MAAGAHREYTAIFAIGGRLLGSFRGAMGQAQSRIRRLMASARSMSRAVAVLGAGLAGLAIGAGVTAGAMLLRKVFTGAEEAYKEQLIINEQLQGVLAANAEIQKLGPDAARKNMEILGKQAGELQKVGVVSDETLLTSAKQLAIYDMSPKKIAEMMPVLGDVIASQKGVNSNMQDGQKVAMQVGKAIHDGQLMGTKRLGLEMGKVDQKAFKAMSREQRRVLIMDALVKKYGGINEAIGKTDPGIIKRSAHAFGELQERIGKIKEQMKVPFAEFLIGLLPRLEPIVERIGNAFTKMFSGANAGGKKFGDLLADKIVGALETFAGWMEYLAANPQWITFAKDLGVAFLGVSAALWAISAAMAVTPMGWIAIAAAAAYLLYQNWDLVAESIQGAWEEMKQWEGIGPIMQAAETDFTWLGQQLKAIQDSQFAASWNSKVASMDQSWNTFIDKVKGWDWSGWGDKLNNALVGLDTKASAIFSAIGSAILRFLVQPMKDAVTAWTNLRTAFGMAPPTIQAPNIPQAPPAPSPALNVPTTAMESPVPTYQLGGIIRRNMLAQVGERGPEAIIPLGGGRRAEGLLNYASRAMGMGGVGGGGGTTSLNFAPVVTINGNATEGEQRAMDSRLRDLANDFIAQFKRAQNQERRLSYESGYA